MKVPLISIFMAHRSSGMPVLGKFFKNIINKAHDPTNFEICIKLDDDDPVLDKTIKVISHYSSTVNIKYIVDSRGNGYTDLHFAYQNLLRIRSLNSYFFWVLADDVVIESEKWDLIISSYISRFYDDLFTLHPTMVHKMILPENPIFYLQKLETFPIWTKRWIFKMQNFGLTWATDAWTSLVERQLYLDYNIDRRIDLTDSFKLYRTLRSGEEGHHRGSRKYAIAKDTHKYLLSNHVKPFIKEAASNIARAIRSNNIDNPSCNQKTERTLK